MKKTLLALTFLSSIVSFAQDWAPFKTTDTLKHFLAEDSIQFHPNLRYIHPIQSIVADSAYVNGNVTNLAFKKGIPALSFFYQDLFSPNPPSSINPLKERNKGRMFGDSVTIQANSSIFRSIDSLGFELFFPHDYYLNKIWGLGTSVDYLIVATVDSVYTDTVMGAIDSIAKASLVVLDLFPFIVPNHPINNSYFIISKNHGMLSMPDFTQLEGRPFQYNSFSGLNQPITVDENNVLTKGDEFHFTNNELLSPMFSDYYTIVRVVDDTLINNQRTITFERSYQQVFQTISSVVMSNYARTFGVDSIFSSTESGMLKFNMYPYAEIFGISNSTGFNKLVKHRFLDFSVNYDPIKQSFDSLIYPFNSGLNWSYFQDIIGIDDESHIYGQNGVGLNYDTKTIVYVKKGNQTWGTPLTLITSLDETRGNSNQISFYPNPVQNILNINSGINIISGAIFDLHGKVIIEFGNEKQLDVSNLTQGIYFLRIQTEEGVLTSKFLKE